MNGALKKVLIVGGNGFIGSAVCKAALARGLQVISVSSSGEPYRTPKGHSPVWVAKVDWQKGDALAPESFAHLFPEVGGVVHTLGTLIPGGAYKRDLKTGSGLHFLANFLRSWGTGRNPLETKAEQQRGSYEMMNRDSALRVCQAFLSSSPSVGVRDVPRPFIYLSAEDIFRAVIPAKYIETKREAERHIDDMIRDRPDYRAVFIRPSLVYHAHFRPLTTPPAVFFDMSASIHAKVPRGLPTPASILRSAGSYAGSLGGGLPAVLESVAKALVTPPIHVDHVGEAVCAALDPALDVRGVVDVRRMRDLIGWSERGDIAADGA